MCKSKAWELWSRPLCYRTGEAWTCEAQGPSTSEPQVPASCWLQKCVAPPFLMEPSAPQFSPASFIPPSSPSSTLASSFLSEKLLSYCNLWACASQSSCQCRTTCSWITTLTMSCPSVHTLDIRRSFIHCPRRFTFSYVPVASECTQWHVFNVTFFFWLPVKVEPFFCLYAQNVAIS